MTFEDWMDRTTKFQVGVRNPMLEEVDEAFKAVRNLIMPSSQAALTELRKKFYAWIALQMDPVEYGLVNQDGAVDELKMMLDPNWRVAQLAAGQARQLALREEIGEYSVNDVVWQKFGPHDRDFPDQEFEWDVNFGLIKRRGVIECKVRIATTVNDETASNLTVIPQDERDAFRTHIRTAWNVGTVEVYKSHGTQKFDLQFDLEWVDEALNLPKYRLNVNKVHRPEGHRDNMLNWLFGNRQACIHEFGHMIGNPDEYNTVAIRGCHTQIMDRALYSGPGYTTNSIMNNPGPAGRVHNRHFNFVGFHIGKMLGMPVRVKILGGPTQNAQNVAAPMVQRGPTAAVQATPPQRTATAADRQGGHFQLRDVYAAHGRPTPPRKY